MDAQGINALITLAGVIGGVVVVGVIAVKTIKHFRAIMAVGTPCAGPDDFGNMERKIDPYDPATGIAMSSVPGNINYTD